MNHPSRRQLLALATPLLLPAAAHAQLAAGRRAEPAAPLGWPSHPIRLLVGFPGGSVQDLSARAIADPLAKLLGQPVVVENKAGASGSIAGDAVAKATDDHTFGVMNNTTLTVVKMLNPATPFDPAKDFQPIALIGTQPLVLLTSAAATGSRPADWLQWLRNVPNANYGSPGVGTPGHLGMELIRGKLNLNAQHVPYPGNPQVINALLANQLHAALLPPGLVMGHIRTGKLKGIGITTPGRSAQAPELAPLAELGVHKAEMDLWTALAAPARLPKAIAARMTAAVVEVVRSEEGRSRLVKVGWQPTPSTAEGLAARMRSDTNLFGGIIMMRGIKVE